MTKTLGKICTTSLFALMATAPQMSLAQDSDQNDAFTLEEIIVTARMRSESLQDVPLSETAFSAQAIEDSRIDTADDFLQLTPPM